MIYAIRNIIDRDNVAAYIKGLDIKQPLSVSIKRRIKRRTLPQNSLYWLWLTAIQIETGNDKDDLHNYFRNKYLQKEIFVVLGKQCTRLMSTSKLNTVEFTRYLEAIQRDMDEIGVQLISPNSPLFEQFMEYYDRKI